MRDLHPPTRLALDLFFLCACASVLFVVHFVTGNGYGFHRDELQFLDDARHLHWGFVAYPPLTSFAGRVSISLFGVSPASLRLPAAIVNAISLVLIGLLARELGGGRAAQLLALCAALPVALAFSSVLQYNTFDYLAWALAAFFVAHLLRTEDARCWLGVGAAIGLGVLSKYSIAFLAASLVAGVVLLPSQRRYLRSRWFYTGAAVALLVAMPNLLWLAHHHFITLQMEHSIHLRDIRLGRTSGYFSDQLKFNLFALPFAILGLVFLLRSTRFRLLSFFYVGPLLLFALARGRGYYLLPGYIVLFAAGGVALETLLHTRTKWFRNSAYLLVFTALLADSVAIGCAFLPLAPVGSSVWSWQMKHNPDMPEEIGWPELARQVASVRDGLSPQARSHLAVFASNYGEAGALALYGGEYGLPQPISNANSFYYRGFGPYEPQTVISVGLPQSLLHQYFFACHVVAQIHNVLGIHNMESDEFPDIAVCGRLRTSWPSFWKQSQRFE